MPQRPRSHQLEELSRRAFVDALPARWVHRRHDPDYALDETVEIFDAADRGTGLAFHVQLKATDEPDLRKALGSVRFSRDTVDYYRAQPIPVLIVRFHAPTTRLFARWFHAYNPHVALDPVGGALTKTVAFRFESQDEWTESTPDALVEAVQAFARFRSAELVRPLRFSFAAADQVRLYDHLFALRTELTPVNELVSIDAGLPGPGHPSIVIGDAATVIALADVASVTLDHDESGITDASAHAVNVATGIGLLLARIGQANLASQVIAPVVARSSIVLDFDTAFTLAGAMTRSRRLLEALRVAEQLGDAAEASDDPDAMRVVAIVFQTAVLSQWRLDDEEIALAIDGARRILERAEARDDRAAASSAAYSLAMLYKRSHDGIHAVAAFEHAAELDPAYEDRDYFNRDLGGVFFELGRYADAAGRYARALALGDGGLTEALHADALLYAGRYEDALAAFDGYLAEDRGPEAAEWRLKRRVLPLIQGIGGPNQVRDPAAADGIAARVDLRGAGEELTIEEAAELVERALELDACCGEAWFRCAFVAFGENEDPMAALEPALAGAVLLRYACGAWMNALMFAYEERGHDELVDDILRAAYRLNGTEFVQELTSGVEAHQERTDILARLDRVVSHADAESRRGGFVLRLRDSDAGHATEFLFLAADDPGDEET